MLTSPPTHRGLGKEYKAVEYYVIYPHIQEACLSRTPSELQPPFAGF